MGPTFCFFLKKQKCFCAFFHDLVIFHSQSGFLKIFGFFFKCVLIDQVLVFLFSDLGCGVCRSLRVDLKLVASCPCSMGRHLCLTVCLLSGAGTIHDPLHAESRAKGIAIALIMNEPKGPMGDGG